LILMGMLISRHRDRHQPAEAGAGPVVDDMKLDELKAYADEHGIDLGDASKKADVLAAVKAATEEHEEPAEAGAESDGGDPE